ncbi:KR-domain-containing protein [Xylariaceae sp. AK1471]|nr:KR-domain-containing protein [Xylariaceae sp. AK1471]
MFQKRIFERRTWAFDENATYLVAGGFGGIGRSILKWMASKGAKYLMVLSRSGHTLPAAVEAVSGLTKQGITVVAPKCDVSSVDSLSQVLGQYRTSLPLIKGLQGSVFDNMTHAQWERTIQSKNLDFFILLSSISGVIGNAGQSNYAVGCTFQDALARYRCYHDQKSISIDLGVMPDVETCFLGIAQVREIEFLTALDIYCDPELGCLPPNKSQVTMGLATPLDLIGRGCEPEAMLQWPLFARFSQTRSASQSSNSTSTMNFALQFQQAESREAQARVVDVDASKPLHVFGVDSLVAVELRNWISKEFAADLSMLDLMSGGSVAEISELVARASKMA